MSTNLKARLFDLLDEKEIAKERIALLEQGIKEREELLDEIKGDLTTALNVAEKRADMVRDLIKENRELKQKQRYVNVEEIKEQIRLEVLQEMEDALENALAKTSRTVGYF